MEIGFNSLKAYIDEKVKEAVEDLKHDFIEAMRTELIKLQTYKMFPYEETVYIKRDDVLRIFEKYTEADTESEAK